MRELKFRFWDSKLKRFISPAAMEYIHPIKDNVGELICISPNSIADISTIIFTGTTDKNGKEIYEGDIVKFRYHTGDFAELTPEEAKETAKSEGKIFKGEVTWDNFSCGFHLIAKQGGLTIYFPMGYARNGKVTGNIYE